MCAANIIIVEKSKAALDHAMALGGDEGVLIDGNENERVLELTKGKGAEARPANGSYATTILGDWLRGRACLEYCVAASRTSARTLTWS